VPQNSPWSSLRSETNDSRQRTGKPENLPCVGGSANCVCGQDYQEACQLGCEWHLGRPELNMEAEIYAFASFNSDLETLLGDRKLKSPKYCFFEI
jgi:hypothetical protein